MLHKLLPDQVEKFDKPIIYAINKSVPKSEGDSLHIYNMVIEGVITNSFQVWVSTKDENVLGVVITSFITDIFTGNKSLLIYAMASFVEVTIDSFYEGFEIIKKFALFNNCVKIVAYTDDPQIVSLTKRLSVVRSRIYIEMEV